MPLNQIIFAACFIATVIFVFSRGGRAEKNVAVVLIVAALLTPIAQVSSFEQFQFWVALIDTSVFLIAVGIAVRFKRATLHFTCMMLLLVVLSHVARLITGPVNGWSYGSLVAMCSYLALVALAWSSFAPTVKSLVVHTPDHGVAPGNSPRVGDVGEAVLTTTLPTAPRFGEPQRCQDTPSEEALSDTALLERLLSFYGCGTHAGALSSALIQKAGSLGAVVRAPPDRLVRWGAAPEVVTAIGLAAQILKVTLKRELFSRPIFSGTIAVLDYFQYVRAFSKHSLLQK